MDKIEELDGQIDLLTQRMDGLGSALIIMAEAFGPAAGAALRDRMKALADRLDTAGAREELLTIADEIGAQSDAILSFIKQIETPKRVFVRMDEPKKPRGA